MTGQDASSLAGSAAGDSSGRTRLVLAFVSGALIGVLGGMIGLGGAEFRLPLLIGIFGFAALQDLYSAKLLVRLLDQTETSGDHAAVWQIDLLLLYPAVSGMTATPRSWSEQRLAAGAGNARAASGPPGGRTGLERRLDGGSDELRGFRVDGDVAAEQHAAHDLPGVPGRVLGAIGHISAPS